MDSSRAFLYVFEDKDWFKKFTIMGLISLIPILGQIVLFGWMIDIIKNVIRHEPVTLPDLAFGGQLSRGFNVTVIGIVYQLPVIVMAIISAVFYSGNGNERNYLVLVTCICLCFVYSIYAIIQYFIYPIAFGRFTETGKISEGLKLGEIFCMIKKAPGAIFIALLGAFVASLIAPLGAIAFGIGVLYTFVYSFAIIGHLFGQAYNVASGN
jgi:hypothetical protein